MRVCADQCRLYELKAYEWLTTMVKKSETWVILFFIIWSIGGISLLSLLVGYLDDILGIESIEPHPIIVLLIFLLWAIIFFISGDILQQRVHANLEDWVYFHIQTKWKFREKPISLLYYYLPTLLPVLLSLLVAAVLLCLALLWIISDNDISKFIENISNFTSVILVFIFMAQAWIFYQQYRHMTKPFFKTTLLWTLSKSNSDTDCRILLKNGGTAPIFDVSYRISKVLVKDRWGYKGYKKVKSEEISKDFLPRLDEESEKEIFEKPTEEFKEMRLAVYLSADTLDGRSTRLLFYKSPGAMDFRLAGIIRT